MERLYTMYKNDVIKDKDTKNIDTYTCIHLYPSSYFPVSVGSDFNILISWGLHVATTIETMTTFEKSLIKRKKILNKIQQHSATTIEIPTLINFYRKLRSIWFLCSLC